jgi:hypothetical protein
MARYVFLFVINQQLVVKLRAQATLKWKSDHLLLHSNNSTGSTPIDASGNLLVAFQIFSSKSQESQIFVPNVRVYFVSDLRFSGGHKIGFIGARDLT